MENPSISSYREFLNSKTIVAPSVGFDVKSHDLPLNLYHFQKDLVHWALRKGRAALFCDTGLGKSFMQLAWAHQVAARETAAVLILAPLAVAKQTVAEGNRWGLPVRYAADGSEMTGGTWDEGVWITNYERLHRFQNIPLAGVVLDESSILKNFSGKTKKALIERFRTTHYRLCCTATPAPNDVVELCNHADFLGVMSPAEMISTFFLSVGSRDKDEGKFRLKRHARKDFFRWLASWAMAVRKPSDLGYVDDGYLLPELLIKPVIVETGWHPPDQLFATGLHGIQQRAEVRRDTIGQRVAAAVDLVRSEPDEAWLLWCGLNEEGRELAKALPDAVLVEGSDDPETKAQALTDFADGKTKVLISKPTIAGFGMNFQRCSRMAFVGIGDSFELYYQAIRRCWRYGQTRPVHAYVVIADAEADVYNNVLRKESEAADLQSELAANVVEFERMQLHQSATKRDPYEPSQSVQMPSWLKGAAA